MTTIKRMTPADRRGQILGVAVDLARKDGYTNITREGLAGAVGVSVGLINRYFLAMPELRRQVMLEAIRLEVPEIIAQGLVNGDPLAVNAPGPLKFKAALVLAS